MDTIPRDCPRADGDTDSTPVRACCSHLYRGHLRRLRHDLTLASERQHRYCFGHWKPLYLVHFMIVVGDVARDIPHQVEMHELVISDSRSPLRRLIPVLGLLDEGGGAGNDPCFLPNLPN